MPGRDVFREVLRLFLVCGILATAQPVRSQVIYADDTATGADDGSSWCNAYNSLQDALKVALESGGAITEIRVAVGVYKPDQGRQQTPGDRAATFRLINGVTITGGYAGCGASDPDARDIAAYETTLNGDLSGNDVGERWDPSRYENSHHIVTGSGTVATAILDGFTIAAGRADGDDPYDSGAGVYSASGSPTLVDCTFTGNWASEHGGGMYNTGSSSPTLTNCTFSSNSADYGGGISNGDDSAATLVDCTFRGNTVGYYGGGMHSGESSTPILTGCSFQENAAYYNGGGVYCTDQSGPTLTNCIFAENTAMTGGAMFNTTTAVLILTNCTLAGNTARYGGGGIYNVDSDPTVVNCILRGNSNSGSTDEPAQIHNTSGATPAVDYCCIQGWTGSLGGDGNMGDDPLFVPGPAGCYYLSCAAAGQPADSSCIDAGSDTAANLNLGTMTTRSDEAIDAGVVDLGYHYSVTGKPLVMGDFNRSGDVDPLDFAHWENCVTAPQPGGVSPCCCIFDFEHDRDVDLNDFAAFQRAFTGPQE